MTTYGDCNTAENDVSADTETTVAQLTIPAGRGGRIKQIRISGGSVATTVKETSGYVELKLGSHAGPYRYPIGTGNVDADLSAQGHNTAFKVEVDIPVDASETVDILLTMNCAFNGAHAGIVWES